MKHLLLILVILTLFTSCSKDKDEPENRPPDIWTSEITDITYHSATLTWNGDDYDGDDIIWEIVLDGIQIHYGELNYNTGNFYNVYFFELEGLSPATEYSLDLIATDGKGGEAKLSFEFITKTGPPKVETFEIEDIGFYDVVVGGKVLDSGISEISQVGILVNTLPNPVIGDSGFNFPLYLYANNEFHLDLYDMQSNQTYYVRAYAINQEGIGYGEIKSFTALSEVVYTGNLTVNTQEELESFFLSHGNVNRIIGSLQIHGPIYDLSLLDDLAVITGGLSIRNTNLVNFEGLENLEAVSPQDFYEFTVRNNSNLINFKGLENLKVTSNVDISENSSLVNLEGLDNYKLAQNIVINKNNNMQSLNGLQKLEQVGNSFRLTENPQLIDISSLNNLYLIPQSLFILNNNSLTTLTGLEGLLYAKFIQIDFNDLLSDFCPLKPLFEDGFYDIFNVNGNLINPTIDEIIINCE